MKIKTLIVLFVFLIGLIQACFVLDSEAIIYIVGGLSYVLMIMVIVFFRKLEVKSNFDYYRLMFFYLIIGIIAIIRGLFEAQNYWDWKFMIFDTALIMLMPLMSFIGSSKDITQVILFNYFKFLMPVSFIVFFAARTSMNTDGFARFMSPLYLIIMLFPVLTKKWKIIITCLVVVSFFSDLGSRSNLIRIIAGTALMSLYYFRSVLKPYILEIFRIILFALPITLFILGATDTFNIFKIGENSNGRYSTSSTLSNGDERDNDFSADTRTFIYEEEISSSTQRNTWLFGESAAAGYNSPWFEDNLGSKGRERSEVGILNIFNYLGLVGVIGFTLIYFFSSYLCINYSNNYICKLIGLFIAFRWAYSWVEEFTDFDMNSFFLWITIGLCFSMSFRSLNDDELKEWVLGIFDKKFISNKDLV